MKKTALIFALVISIFYLSGCLVISTKEHKHHRHHDVAHKSEELAALANHRLLRIDVAIASALPSGYLEEGQRLNTPSPLLRGIM